MSGLLKWIVLKYCRRVWRSSSFWNEATWFTGCGCSASSCGTVREKRRCWDDLGNLFWAVPPPFPFSSSKMRAHPGSSACRCLLWNAFPRVKVWRSSTKQNGYFKYFVHSFFFFPSWCIEKLCITKKNPNHMIIWWSLMKVLKLHVKHLCNKDKCSMPRNVLVCVSMWFVLW